MSKAEQAALRFSRVRAGTEALVDGLTPEDMAAQAFPEASPAKWHLAHTTWFFETFLLAALEPGRRPFNPRFRMLFNSYYETVGDRPRQADRHVLTRPALPEVMAWRRAVDEAVPNLLERLDDGRLERAMALLELGMAHEEQHQELIVTDMLALFARSPLEPGWFHREPAAAPEASSGGWVAHGGGVVEIGHDGGLDKGGQDGQGFAFDNEGPRHRVLLRPFRLSARPVSVADWLDFMADGGYRRPILWQSDGWEHVQARGWRSPKYWEWRDGSWSAMTPAGRQPLDPKAPVRHVSWYEADAYAAWSGARLPDEAEWEAAAVSRPNLGYGQVWEWTASCHRPYPGWRPPAGAFGEYNGKFMSGRMVCRGGSFATPSGHVRPSYRNFWWPSARWQFTGLRLAEDA